ncbi:MAG TPA: MGMT family protein [Bacteroidota bacterium]|nr:MGMT family protein [Bacteroidota bacterium]
MDQSRQIRSSAWDAYIRIWRTVRRIPRGRVSTYGTIALLAGMPGQARLVGYALHNLPEGADVPWHRVVNAQGKISLPRASGSGRRQAQLLADEGVRYDAGAIRLKTHGWPVSAFRRSR